MFQKNLTIKDKSYVTQKLGQVSKNLLIVQQFQYQYYSMNKNILTLGLANSFLL